MFTISVEYPRQALLNFVGSKQNQSGIIWGINRPECVIITSGGKHGISSGYEDKRNPDGTWDYVGQGSSGNQSENKFANKLLINRQRNVLLFTTREQSTAEYKNSGSRSKLYKYEGLFDVLSHKTVVANSGKRQGDALLLFKLVPPDSIFTNATQDEDVHEVDNLERETKLSALKKAIITIPISERFTLTLQQYRRRSSEVRRYALTRANGICERCGKPAPFQTSNKQPYLEVPHILKLADDGPDLPQNVAAVCPNCHREAHFGSSQELFKQELIVSIENKEKSI